MKTVILKLIENALKRLHNAEDAIIEYLLSHGMFVQPLRLALESVPSNNNQPSGAGLYNSLSPFLIDSRVLLQDNHSNQDQNQTETRSGHLEVEEREMVAKESNEENLLNQGFYPETDVRQDATQDELNEVFDLTPIKNDIQKSKKKKKKKKTTFYPQTETSSFIQWLSVKKPLDPEAHAMKKVKKSKKYKLILETAQKSITPSDEIISESLAKILVAQGHLLEAKKMYKKLIQKHPELSEKYHLDIEIINQMMDENR